MNNVATWLRDGPIGRSLTTLGLDLPLFAGATLLDQGGRLILNLVAAAMLGPVAFGTWVIFALLIQYSTFASFGIPLGAAREVPRLLGAGRAEDAARVEDVSAVGTVATGALAAVVVVAIVPLLLANDELIDPATLPLLAIAVFLQCVFVLEQALFRSRLRFRPASVQLALQGIAAPVVGMALLAVGAGVNGLLVARIAVYVVALALAVRVLARLPTPRWDPGETRRLIAIGLPLLASGILIVLIVTVDRWIVLLLLGPATLGIYGLVALAVSSLILVPSVVSQQYYPRLAFEHGKGADRRALFRMARDQGVLTGAIAGLAAAMVGVAAWFLIPIALPAYETAIGPVLIVLFGVVAYASGTPYGSLLNLFDRQRRYLAIQSVALGLDIVLAVAFIVAGLGISGVALASTLAMTAYSAALHVAATQSAMGEVAAGDRLKSPI